MKEKAIIKFAWKPGSRDGGHGKTDGGLKKIYGKVLFKFTVHTRHLPLKGWLKKRVFYVYLIAV